MKRFLLASTAMLALSGLIGSAHAADLPRQMVTKAPTYVAPYYNWTGFYIGVNGGGGWGTSAWDTTGSFDVSGAMAGGTVGYNWQFGTWVVGLEGDIDWTNIKGSTASAGCFSGNCSSENTWLGTARGRLGYAFDRVMPYVTGGAAFGDVQANQPGFTGMTNTQLGWTVGAGVEFAIANNWTAKVEYLHYDLGSFNCGVACNGFASDNVSFNANVVRGGVNFRF
jgi:outer membrane immunogenic protein